MVGDDQRYVSDNQNGNDDGVVSGRFYGNDKLRACDLS